MEEKLYTVYARLDPSQGERLKATLEREKRTMQAVVELALDRYISESEAQAAKTDTRKAKATA